MIGKSRQYTLRGVPENLDRCLRESAVAYGTSVNQAALTALSRGLGLGEDIVERSDLDDLVGTWVQDEAFDKAVADMDRIDPDLWK